MCAYSRKDFGVKDRDRCLLMWCRFSSIQFYIVNLLHYRGHMYILQLSGRNSTLSSSLLMCLFTFELQSESST